MTEPRDIPENLTTEREWNKLVYQRLEKVEAVRAAGRNPWPNDFQPDADTARVVADNEALSAEQLDEQAKGANPRRYKLAGRLMANNFFGKAAFLRLQDRAGRLQVFVRKDGVGEQAFADYKTWDIGDLIAVEGTPMRTKTGELTLGATSIRLLAKALRPLPEKWHGLKDKEQRFRQRYVDLIVNPEVRDIFLKRNRILKGIRDYLDTRGYLEVETPMMQAIPGGAAARPFKTHHNALGCDFYLRIALELPLKRLLVGGMERVFEIGRNFRNEGLSRRHNPEFTMLEAYQAYGDYETMMELVQSMVCQVAQKVLGTLVIQHAQEPALIASLHQAVRVVDETSTHLTGNLLKNAPSEIAAQFVGEIGKVRAALVATQEQIGKAPVAEVAQAAINTLLAAIGLVSLNKLGLASDAQAPEGVMSTAAAPFDAVVRSLEKLLTPKVIDLTPPWRRVRYKDLLRERAGADWFEVDAATRRRRAVELGAEIGDGHEDFEVTQAVFEKLIEPTLINPTFVTHAPKQLIPLAKLAPDDPDCVEVFECCINGQEIAPAYSEQNDPLEQRERLEHQAGGEQQKLDEDFLVALEHGMPPAGGMGMGIDRLCMMLLGQESIRDVILFPQLRPK